VVRGIGFSGFHSSGKELLQAIVDVCEEARRLK
jgi:hypothetical protein